MYKADQTVVVFSSKGNDLGDGSSSGSSTFTMPNDTGWSMRESRAFCRVHMLRRVPFRNWRCWYQDCSVSCNLSKAPLYRRASRTLAFPLGDTVIRSDDCLERHQRTRMGWQLCSSRIIRGRAGIRDMRDATFRKAKLLAITLLQDQASCFDRELMKHSSLPTGDRLRLGLLSIPSSLLL